MADKGRRLTSHGLTGSDNKGKSITSHGLLGDAALAPPSGASATPGAGQLVLAWTDPVDPSVSHIRVYGAAVSGGPYELLATVSAGTETYTLSDLESTATIYFVLTSYVETTDQESSYTEEFSGTPLDPGADALTSVISHGMFGGLTGVVSHGLMGDGEEYEGGEIAVPANLLASGGNTLVILAWDDPDVPDLTEIRIYKSESSGGPYVLVDSVPPGTEIYSVTGLENGVPYYFALKAVGESGESEYSEEISATPAVSSGGPKETVQEFTRGGGMAVSIDYSRGDEDGIAITFEVYDPVTEDWYVVTSTGPTGTLSSNPVAIQILDSGQYRVPIRLAGFEKKLRASYTFLGEGESNGSVSVEVGRDTPPFPW